MRRILIAAIAGGFLLASGVAASAKPDTATGEQGQNGQQQQQNDKKSPTTPAAKPSTESTAQPTPKPAPKPATAASPTTCSPQAEQTGDFQGEHQDADCNGQQDQAGANESKTEGPDATEKTGNNED